MRCIKSVLVECSGGLQPNLSVALSRRVSLRNILVVLQNATGTLQQCELTCGAMVACHRHSIKFEKTFGRLRKNTEQLQDAFASCFLGFGSSSFGLLSLTT